MKRANEIDAENGYSQLVGLQQQDLHDLIDENADYLRTINDFKEFTRMAENDLS